MFIYFIRCQEFVKIGRSQNPWKRMNSMQTSLPYRLEMLAIMPGGDNFEEIDMHTRFGRQWHLREWYKDHDELRRYVRQVREAYPELQITPPRGRRGGKGRPRKVVSIEA